MDVEFSVGPAVTTPKREGVSTSDLYEALSGEIRWRSIEFLASIDGWVPVDELVHHVATTMKTQDTAVARRRLRIEFHHNHLPKMEDLGIIERDEYRVRLLVDPIDGSRRTGE